VVSAAVEAVEPAIRRRRHELSVRSGLRMAVIGDAARLQQCLVNLLTNAAKYTDPGGRIWLDVEQHGGQAVIRVTDNGAGIPQALLPHVFELFVQNDRTLDRALGGLGIGLSVVKRLVEMHGGTVSAHSEGAGKGAAFEIRLPLAEAAVLVHEAEPGGPATPCKLLVVDDNRDAAESLCMVLEAEGHDVRCAFSAQQALASAPEWRPDLVLLDIGLPGMDGYEVARRLRAEPALARCCLVALTGYGQPSDQQRARDAGFDHHLVKPAPLEEISRLIRRLAAQDAVDR
jgi:CheY-like chemotaxis protein/anti-sigma regulatory factor (Ser/Thr protein kinase)